ncbi:MAG: hypothetical protein WCY19_08305 [Candidatus Gastranaerophilaceae bacterium]
MSEKTYNNKYDRWEAYSEADDIHIYYSKLRKQNIRIISAFKT